MQATLRPLAGVLPVLPSIFTGSGELDHEGFGRVVEFVIGCGVDGVVFPGLASEHDCLSIEERLSLIELAGHIVAGRATFVVGASAPAAEESARLIDAGARAGAAAAMIMAPATRAASEAELAAYYRQLASADIPLMLQNAPRPMGAGVAPDVVLETVAAVPRIRYVKEENVPGGHRITSLLTHRPPTLLGVFGGAGGRYVLDELVRGAIGTMPASEIPELHVALWRAFREGRHDAAATFYERMLPILMMQAVFRWRLTKEILLERGLIGSAFARAEGPRLDLIDRRELRSMMQRLADLIGAH